MTRELGSVLVLTCVVACSCAPIFGGTIGGGPMVQSCPPVATSWALSDAQRRAFLHHYSPIIFKQADEPVGLAGRDWITNFNFDADGGRLSNNRRNWETQLWRFVYQGAHPAWAIRPTLYSHLIEVTENGSKSVVLLYHVYHAMQLGSIHDWERVELRLDGVSGAPGSGETIAYAVVTEHSLHRAGYEPDIRFHETPHGKHLMVWQAPWGLALQPSTSPPGATPMTGQLGFVEDDWTTVEKAVHTNGPAILGVTGTTLGQGFHYVFVDEADPDAVHFWKAAAITATNRLQMAAGLPSWQPVNTDDVKRITYELQDTADILASHLDLGGPAPKGLLACLCPNGWGCGPHGNESWTCPRVTVRLENPVLDELGTIEIDVGRREFLARSLDDENPFEDRKGYPRKHWFWGTYSLNRSDSFTGEAFERGTPNRSRGVANGRPDSHGKYWHQHDYFAHSGPEASGTGPDAEVGHWLCADWHRSANGGFDGRWVQLFPD